MFKILVFIAAGFLLYKLIIGNKKKKMEQKSKKYEDSVSSGEMVKDPVCGTYVSSNSDIRVKDNKGKVYCFCSYECRDKFLENSTEENQ